MLSDAEAELERENIALRSALARERRARELRSEVNRLAARTSAEVSRSGVAQVIVDGAAEIFDAGWASIAFVDDDDTAMLVHGPGVPPVIRRDWQRIPLESEVPICHVLRGVEPLVALSSVSESLAWGLSPELVAEAEMGSVVVSGIGLGDRPAAAIAIAWPDAHELDGVELELLAQLTQRAGPGFERSMRTEVEGELARRLQTMMLGKPISEVRGFDVATLYEPGRDFQAVGGDWFDVVQLEVDRCAFVIGDVVGHDLSAAIEMTQIRDVLAAHLVASGDPVEAMSATDAYLRRRSPGVMATALVFVVDSDGTARTCSAGHPGPIVGRPGAGFAQIAGAVGPPLGSGFGGHSASESEVSDGTVLVGFTDGVVEARDRDLDVEIAELASEVEHELADGASARRPVDRVRDLVARRAARGWRTDDAAAVIVQILPR
ncbi:PP2C family protein-serine/threonine phosphatase [Ilumatobacter sp.]|uniref:PP2C family protein-serine/threonine phosphatase n=1 Tax=Ilumatobacter sp. TaxID=1967498 RepID=UPI003B51F668